MRSGTPCLGGLESDRNFLRPQGVNELGVLVEEAFVHPRLGADGSRIEGYLSIYGNNRSSPPRGRQGSGQASGWLCRSGSPIAWRPRCRREASPYDSHCPYRVIITNHLDADGRQAPMIRIERTDPRVVQIVTQLPRHLPGRIPFPRRLLHRRVRPRWHGSGMLISALEQGPVPSLPRRPVKLG